MDICQPILRASIIYKWGPDTNLIVPESLHTHQHRMLVNLKNWAEAFTTIDSSLDPSASSSSSSSSDTYAATLLQLYHLIVDMDLDLR
jgi:hypothetical protein